MLNDILIDLFSIWIQVWLCILIVFLLLWCVRKLLRHIYVKEIIDKIETAEIQLLAITNNLIRVYSEDYGAKILRYEEKYKVLKELNEYLLKSKWWIQDYLMTPEEKKRCKEVFVRCVNVEKELLSCYLQEYSKKNKDYEIICSKWYCNWLHSMR